MKILLKTMPHDTQNLTKSEFVALGNKLFVELNEAWVDVASELDCGNQIVDIEDIETEPRKRQLSLIFDLVVKTKKCLEDILQDLKKGLQVHSVKTLKKCFSGLSETVKNSEEVDRSESLSRVLLHKVQQDEEKFLKGITSVINR